MKKVTMALFVVVFASLGLFAQRSFVESDKLERALDAKAKQLVQEVQAKQELIFEVGKYNQKEIALDKKFALHTTELNMGTYDLLFSKANGKLFVQAKLHEGEKNFPRHILVFDLQNTDRVRVTPSTQYENEQIYFIEMNLLTAKGEWVTTYTLGATY